MSSFKDHFSSHAADYAAFRPTYPIALVDFLVSISPATDLAFDCGCGNGQLSVLLADRFDRVIAIDASAKQIENAEAHPRIEYRCAPAEQSGLPESIADLVVAAQSAHWFDLPTFYEEVRRVARQQAIVALVTYKLIQVNDIVDSVISHFYSEVVGPYWPFDRRHVEEGYRSFPFPFREIETPNFTIEAEWGALDIVAYVDTWSAVREAEKALGRKPMEQFCHDLLTVWTAESPKRTVKLPLALRVGHV
ncbi:MAG: class I SAM-dependent methyltransferase [Pyrinomonadaceae bacterium]